MASDVVKSKITLTLNLNLEIFSIGFENQYHREPDMCHLP